MTGLGATILEVGGPVTTLRLRGAAPASEPSTVAAASVALPGTPRLAAIYERAVRQQIESDTVAVSAQFAPRLAAALWGDPFLGRPVRAARHRAGLAALLRGWLEAPTTPDEERWPEVARALDEDRLSGRKLFP